MSDSAMPKASSPHSLPPLSRRKRARLCLVPLDQDFGFAPVSQLGSRNGLPPQPEVSVLPSWQSQLKTWTQAQLHRLIHRYPLTARLNYELEQFSLELARFLVLLHRLDPADKYHVIAVERALVDLHIRVQDGLLGYCTDLSCLLALHLQQQLAVLSLPALEQMACHTQWLMQGTDDGLMRSLTARNAFRLTGFGMYEDYLRNMSREDFTRLMRDHAVLEAEGAALLRQLLDAIQQQRPKL